ncbi:hypothetical protein HNR62_001744 [Oceanisphaera litoralis]|uniref:hypothetical protein n=1 Tax=Oceanisphaera litoralis TaxID=225144 RepID=UPI00195E8507|nr:hypothetical protein [Oceanisphaera litoralis]MBM7455865.1 hypothetical protein [Oceanisphaera litoralis]
MMITELMDQDDFRARLQAWGLEGANRQTLAECSDRLSEALAGPEREPWQQRLASLLAKRELLHPEVQALLDACMK